MNLPATIEPQVEISWDGSGAFDGAYDDVTADVLSDPGLTVTQGRDGARTLNPPKVGDSGLDLLNESGAYSQERPDSTVYQRVTPGRPVRESVRHGERRTYRSHTLYRDHVPYRGRALYRVHRGVLDDIRQSTAMGNRRVSLSTLSTETVLTKAAVTVGVMTNPRVDQCVTALLDAVGWPAADRSIAVADTTLAYWWCDNRDPWSALVELVNAEGTGTVWVDGAGVFHFENRNFRATNARSTTSQATLFDVVAGQRTRYRDHVLYRGDRLYRGRTSGLYFTQLDYEPGFKSIYNRATYAVNTRAAGTPATVIWTYGTTLALGSGASRTLIARPASGDPFTDAITPALTTDYTVGGGTVSVSLAADSGLVAFITITATSGTPTVSGLQLRATPLAKVSETVIENTVDASDSIARFSPVPGEDIPIPLAVQGWPEIDQPNAEAVCNAWVNRYMEPRPQIPIVVRNADAAHTRLILDARPSDRWTLIEANTGLSADVWINSKEITISGQGGRIVEAVLGCEKVEGLSGFVWDGLTSLWGTATWGT